MQQSALIRIVVFGGNFAIATLIALLINNHYKTSYSSKGSNETILDCHTMFTDNGEKNPISPIEPCCFRYCFYAEIDPQHTLVTSRHDINVSLGEGDLKRYLTV